MKVDRLFLNTTFLTIIVATALVSIQAQVEAGGRVGGAGMGGDSTYRPKTRPVAKHTAVKRTTRTGKTAAQYEADGNKFWDEKDYDSALEAYQSSVNIKPSATPLYRIGWIQNDFGEFDKALVALGRAIPLDSDFYALYLEQGYALRRLKRNAEAAVALKKCIDLNSQSSTCHYELGLIYFDQKQFDSAVTMFSAATSIRPDYQDAYEELGIALRRLGRNDEALEALDKAIELNPQDGNAYMGLGDVYYYGTKDYRKAIDAYVKGLQYQPDNDVAAYNVGWASNDLGNYEEAITYLTKATQIKSNYVSAYNELGFAYMRLKRYGEATTALRRSIVLDQNNQLAHYYLGLVYNTTNNKNAALGEYRELQRLGSDYAAKLYKIINQ